MGLIERIKSALGLRSSGSESQSRATTGDGSSPSRDSATESDRDDIETGRETETGVETGTGDEVESDDDSGSDAGTGDDYVDVTVEHEPETDSRDTEPDGESAAVGERPTDSEPAPDAAEQAQHGPDATPEQTQAEPDTASEDAVKGTDTDTGEGGADADVEDLKGIGPTYGERLREAGYGTVDALAAADADTVADESGIAESRIEKWIDRARTY